MYLTEEYIYVMYCHIIPSSGGSCGVRPARDEDNEVVDMEATA